MNLLNEVGSDLSGLEKLRVMLADGRRSGYAETLDIRLVEADEGRVVLESAPGAHVFNSVGTVHGGFIASLLDSACGYAAVSRLTPRHAIATLELKVSYHKAVTHDVGVLRAVGLILTIGRRVAFAEAKLFDVSGRLYASATSTLLVTTTTTGTPVG
jgi:uncharacterized protein (TIGR00369 family)